MPFFGKSSSSPTSKADTARHSIREYFGGMPQQPTRPQAQTRKAPGAPAPNPSRPHSRLSSSEPEAQFIWEDIEPPAEYLAYMNRSATNLPPKYSTTPQPYPGFQPQEQEQVHTMLTHHSNPSATSLTSTTTATTTNSNTNTNTDNAPPLYNDVSGSVVVDEAGFPRFLTPQEELNRKDTLANAVHERMMGLPRRTEFSWDASGGPVLPRYEPPVAGVGVGVGAGIGAEAEADARSGGGVGNLKR